MPETTRTFVAIAIPELRGAQLARLQQELTPAVPGCRWTVSVPFHATLVFLGDIANRELNEVCDIVAARARPFDPLEVELAGLGAFPSASRARVIWAGLKAPNLQPLLELRDRIVASLGKAGHRIDDQEYHPHVTLGRIKSERRRAPDLSALLERYRSWSAGGFTVSEVITFASKVGPGGSQYDPLGRAPLLGENTVDSP
jgi:2'-5' RNA ligase